MIHFLLWISSLVFFTLIFRITIFHIYRKKIKIQERISPFIAKNNQSKEETLKGDSFKERIFLPLISKLHVFLLKVMPKQKLIEMEKKLREAGNPFGLTSTAFYTAQFGISIVSLLFSSLIFIPSADNIAIGMFLAILFPLFVLVYSNYYLNAKRKMRIRLIEKSMPDFFDMVNVSIEAGMGLDGAVKRVCSQVEGPISQEFLLTLEDMKLGKTRKQAFSELRERVASDFFKSVISALIQADQMGIGMTKVLRAQTTRIREKQRQQAKEQAMKAPVKMMIPMVLFIFPTLFIVLLGPVIVQLVTTWL